MTNLKTTAAALITALSLAAPALADSATGKFAARGIGALPCTSVANLPTQPEQEKSREDLARWLSGYISHRSRVTDGFYETSPVQSNVAFAVLVEAFCRRNPGAIVESVTDTLLNALKPLASTEETELLTLKNGAGSVVVRADVLKKVQEFLVADGLLEEKQADGQFGPKTSKAILDYQKKKGLGQNGLPEAFTLLRIAQDIK